jgi:hypothetical protein
LIGTDLHLIQERGNVDILGDHKFEVSSGGNKFLKDGNMGRKVLNYLGNRLTWSQGAQEKNWTS